MIFEVIPMREKGWALPRFRSCMVRPVRADLEVRDVVDPHMHRATRVAQLLDPVTRKPLERPPPLYDAVLICAKPDYMTLTGFERIMDDFGQREYHYAQSWLLTPATDGEQR